MIGEFSEFSQQRNIVELLNIYIGRSAPSVKVVINGLQTLIFVILNLLYKLQFSVVFYEFYT